MPTFNQLVLYPNKKRKNKCNVKGLAKCPQRLGTCIKARIVSPKKPNSAQRKIAKVKLTSKHNILACIKGQGHSLRPYSNVLVEGGRANDLPGVRYSLIRGKFDFS